MALGTLKGEDEADPYLHLNMASWILTVYIIYASYFFGVVPNSKQKQLKEDYTLVHSLRASSPLQWGGRDSRNMRWQSHFIHSQETEGDKY